MRNVWAIRWHNSKVLSLLKTFRPPRRTKTYESVYQRTSAYCKLISNLSITYSTYASILAKFFIRRHTFSKMPRCDRVINQTTILQGFNNKFFVVYTCTRTLWLENEVTWCFFQTIYLWSELIYVFYLQISCLNIKL